MPYDPTKPVNGEDGDADEVRAQLEGLRAALWGVNLVRDSRGLIWPDGDSAAPAHYAVQGGAGSAIARETSTVYGGIGTAFEVTGATAASEYLQQTILGTATFLPVLQSTYVSLGCAVRAGAATSARIGIYDGQGTTWSDYGANGTWEWLTVTRLLDAAADRLVIQMQTAQGITSHFAVPTGWLGDAPPDGPKPSPSGIYLVGPGAMGGDLPASYATVNGWRDAATLPWIADRVYLVCGTAPTGQAIIVDANKGGTSMFGTRPEIAASATSGSSSTFGTYANRCFDAGDILTVDLDQAGSGTPGDDLTIKVEGTCFPHPFRAWIGGAAALAETGA